MQDKNLERLVIPGKIENYPVTKISEEAFAFCENLIHVVIPETVQVIGERAFRMCHNLHSMKLPGSVKKIHSTAIMGCIDLKEIYVKKDSYAEEWASEYWFEVLYF